jgi:hypothetical protein
VVNVVVMFSNISRIVRKKRAETGRSGGRDETNYILLPSSGESLEGNICLKYLMRNPYLVPSISGIP